MPVLEICVDTHEGLATAINAGADRIELCSALSLGGLSPNLSLLHAACQVTIPVFVMIRPRPGNFHYSPTEISGMINEIQTVKNMGLAGVVFGAGDENGLDMPALKTLCDAAKVLGKTLHRVVDLLSERQTILSDVSEIGIDRILTSGGADRAVNGLDDITEMVANSPAGLVIMPGSGVRPDNINHILTRTGANEIHASGSIPRDEPSKRAVELGFSSKTTSTTDHDTVGSLAHFCRNHKVLAPSKSET